MKRTSYLHQLIIPVSSGRPGMLRRLPYRLGSRRCDSDAGGGPRAAASTSASRTTPIVRGSRRSVRCGHRGRHCLARRGGGGGGDQSPIIEVRSAVEMFGDLLLPIKVTVFLLNSVCLRVAEVSPLLLPPPLLSNLHRNRCPGSGCEGDSWCYRQSFVGR